MIQSYIGLLITLLTLTSSNAFAEQCSLKTCTFAAATSPKIIFLYNKSYDEITSSIAVTSTCENANIQSSATTIEGCFNSAIESAPKFQNKYVQWSFGENSGKVDYTTDKNLTPDGDQTSKHEGCILYLAGSQGKPHTTPYSVLSKIQVKSKNKKDSNMEGFETPPPPYQHVENNSESFTIFPSTDKVEEEVEIKNEFNEKDFGRISFYSVIVNGKTSQETALNCKKYADQTLTTFYKKTAPKGYTKIHWEVEHPWKRNTKGWIIPSNSLLMENQYRH